MLQQTQTFRVEEYLPRFLKQFPTVKHLAKAPRGEVIRLWQGLGYNRRAVNLHRTAEAVVKDHKGIFPKDDESLLKLPGIGEYTMRALQVFAFGKRVSVVDVNVVRVLSRLTKKMPVTTSKLSVADIHKINTALLPPAADKWHEALMDLGATICRSKPQCEQCPITKQCASYPTLSTAKHSPEKKNPNERIYFGKPKRIWRGRILKIVAEQDNISVSALPKQLSSLTTKHSTEFASFIKGVALELADEGLCRRQGSYFTINSHE
jgi:A/G-specific adenine glycosylase